MHDWINAFKLELEVLVNSFYSGLDFSYFEQHCIIQLITKLYFQ